MKQTTLYFNEILKKIIENNVIKINELSLKTGIKLRTLKRYLNFENIININTANLIVDFLNEKNIDIYDYIFYKNVEKDIYYHGSKSEIIGEISVNKNVTSKHDFGNGFYLGESFMQSSTLISGYHNNKGTIYKIRFNKKGLIVKEVKIDPPNYDWFFYISYNREYLESYNGVEKIKYKMALFDKDENGDQVDVMIGPIADDAMYYSTTKFFENEINTKQLEINLKRLNIGNQIVIKTTRACKCLEIIESIKLDKTMYYLIKKYSVNKRERAIKESINIKNVKYEGELFSTILKRYK